MHRTRVRGRRVNFLHESGTRRIVCGSSAGIEAAATAGSYRHRRKSRDAEIARRRGGVSLALSEVTREKERVDAEEVVGVNARLAIGVSRGVVTEKVIGGGETPAQKEGIQTSASGEVKRERITDVAAMATQGAREMVL